MGDREEVDQIIQLALYAIAKDKGVPQDELPVEVEQVVTRAIGEAWRKGMRYGWKLARARRTLPGVGDPE